MNAPSVARACLVGAKLAQPRADPVAQLGRGLLGERDREDRADIDAVLDHGLHETLDQHRGLAAAGARVEQQIAVTRRSIARSLFRPVQRTRHWLRQIPGYAQPSRVARLRARLSAPARRAAASATARSARVRELLVELL